MLEGLRRDCLFLIAELGRRGEPPTVRDVVREMDVSECKARLALTDLVDELYAWVDDDGRFHANGEFRGRRPEPRFVGLFEDEKLAEEF